jgi:hypothetical protein
MRLVRTGPPPSGSLRGPLRRSPANWGKWKSRRLLPYETFMCERVGECVSGTVSGAYARACMRSVASGQRYLEKVPHQPNAR